MVCGRVIPDSAVSNLARELQLEAGLDPSNPAYSTVLACSTSMVAASQAAGMLGRGRAYLALIGGVETMSRVPIALQSQMAERIILPRRAHFSREISICAARLGQPHFRSLDG